MKLDSQDSRHGMSTLRLALTLLAAALIPLLAYAAAPTWWSQRGVLVPNATADDYAPANQGQLKNIARAGVAEMDAQLPGGAGAALHNLVDAWASPTAQTNDFAPVNLGQLKNVAKPFYDRLIAGGVTSAYPWSGSSNPPDDFTVANIGQVKNLFSFDFSRLVLDTDGNGLPDAWEQRFFGHLGVDPNDDPDGDGATNLKEYQRDTDPNHYDVAPSLVLSPDQLTVVVAPGETRTAMLTLSNASSGPLTFQLTPRDTATHDPSFTDSDQPSGPVYEWEDISTTGTRLPSVSNADDGFESFDLGFAFPYFGQSFTSVFVSSNGFITFGSGSDQFDNYQLPGANMPANEIAAFHTDLNTERAGDIYYLNEAERTIIQYERVARYTGQGNVTLQIVLRSDGTIEIRYKTLPLIANDVTVGVQNATRDRGLTVAYAQDYLHPNLAVRISPNQPWLTVSPTSGVVAAAQAQPVTVAFDATYLSIGSYTGSIELSSTASEPVLAVVPVTLIVNHAPTVSLTAPVAGATVLSSASLTLVANAADPDGTISRVQFFADNQLLGESTSTPFNFVWAAPTAGTHVLTAKATDDRGATGASAGISISVLADSDGDNIPDDWERAHFGDLGQTAEDDFDHDGVSNGDEYRTGTDPADYFNGTLPIIVVLSGDNQRGPAGEALPVPLTVRVTNQQGAPLANAPVYFQVAAGNGEIVLVAGGTGPSSQVQTNAAGEASVFCHAPLTRGSRSTVAANCRSGSQTATASFVETAEAFLQATPESLAFAINLPGSQSKTVQLYNNGPASLDFACETDAPSYRFQDSNSTDGPVYEWNDISATGTLLAAVSQSDDDFEAVDLPFSFPFFGQGFSRIYVSSNGFVTVGAGASWGWHASLPGFDMPPGEIAAFHTDLNPAAGGHIYYLNASDRTVIQFDQVQQFDGSGRVTFQIVLEQTGAITFLYNSMNGTLNAASVGLQNLLQDQGVEVTYNKLYLKNGLAVRLTRDNSWLQVSPASGQIEPGQMVEITATGDGARLFEGNYAGLLRVRSAADQSVLELPVTAVTNAAPTVELVAPQRNTGVVVSETLSVEAQAQDRSGQVRRVEFYEGVNLIGAVTNSPFAIGWHPPHAGSFSLTARATDNLGATSVSLPVFVRVEEDSDGDGLGDQWEIANFGNLNQTANDDYDGDGRSNLQEFHDGTPANDYYNGQTPRPVMLSKTRAAGKVKHGFFPFVPTPPGHYFLQSQAVIHLIGGNPESEVSGTITTRVNPDTGAVVEKTTTGNPPNMNYGFMDWDAHPTATTRVDRLTILFGAEANGGAYDDPPNLVDDWQAVAEQMTTLSDEYTTDQLISRTRGAIPPLPPFDAPFSVLDDATFADYEFFAGEHGVYISQSKYQFKWNKSPNLPEQKKIVWLEIFYPFDDPRTPGAEDRTPITTVRSWEGTANETPVYYLSPTIPGRYSISTLPAEPMLDGNRDGQMDFASAAAHGADTTSQDKPYRFWINDDNDTALTSDGGGPPHPAEVETVPSSRKDCDAHQIVSKRNLEDFSRLWIDLGYLQYEVLGGSIQVGLKWKTVESGEPAINIYPSEDGTGSTDYLTDDGAAGRQIAGVFNNAVTDKNNKSTVDRDGTFIFKRDYWNGVTTENSKKCLLFEGKTEGKGELAVVFLDRNGNELTTGSSVWLDLKSIKKMYERWTVGDSNGGAPAAVATLSTRDLPSGGSAFAYDDQSAEEKQYIVFVHGWNLEGRDKDSFAETAYKRLSWQGYKGRFAAFQWPTTYGFQGTIPDLIGDRENYDNGEYSAWRSGAALSNLLAALNATCPGQVYLFGHSMGNVVSGEALRILGRTETSINTYAACEAAVEASAYDPVVDTTFPLHFVYNHPSLPTGTNNYGPTTPNIYPNWLTSNSTGVYKKVSFYNVNDFALYEDFWEFDQISKPDNTGFFAAWGWDGPARPGSGDNLFWRQNNIFAAITPLDFGSEADAQNRYEIMSYAAEPRSRALGRTPGNIAGFTATLDLRTLWPADPNNHRSREWHSGQFMQTNMRQQDFWASLIEQFGISAHP